MTRVLNGNVWVDDKFYAAGSAPVGDVAARIGEHLWSDVDSGPAPAPEPEPGTPDNQPRVDIEGPSQFVSVPIDQDPVTPEAEAETATAPAVPGAPVVRELHPPPRSGLGGREDAWREYAHALGIHITQADGRNEIIAAVRRAGFPV